MPVVDSVKISEELAGFVSSVACSCLIEWGSWLKNDVGSVTASGFREVSFLIPS